MIYPALNSENAFAVSTLTFYGQSVPCFKSADVLILLCLDGEAHVETNLGPHTLRKNTQLMVLPGHLLQFKSTSNPLRLLCIACLGDWFHELANCLEPSFFQFIKDSPCTELTIADVEQLQSIARLLENVQQDTGNRYRRQLAGNYLQNLLFHYYGKTQHLFEQNAMKWVSRKEELFKRFIQLVHEHCATQREVNFYARLLNITPRYLSSVVLAVGGETTKEIIDRHAIAEIKMKLKNSKLNVQEISNSMKFADQSFFGRYFKKHTGMSPLQYRNEA